MTELRRSMTIPLQASRRCAAGPMLAFCAMCLKALLTIIPYIYCLCVHDSAIQISNEAKCGAKHITGTSNTVGQQSAVTNCWA